MMKAMRAIKVNKIKKLLKNQIKITHMIQSKYYKDISYIKIELWVL
jgi:hypothetical protein